MSRNELKQAILKLKEVQKAGENLKQENQSKGENSKSKSGNFGRQNGALFALNNKVSAIPLTAQQQYLISTYTNKSIDISEASNVKMRN